MKEGIECPKNNGFGFIRMVQWGLDYLMGTECPEATQEFPETTIDSKVVSSYIPVEERNQSNIFEFFVTGDSDDTIFDVYLQGTGQKLEAIPYCPEDAAPQGLCSVQQFVEQGFANKDLCSLIETETDAPYSLHDAFVPNATSMISDKNNVTLFDSAGKTVTSLLDAAQELAENAKEYIDDNPETVMYAGAIAAGLAVGTAVAAVGSWLWRSRKPAEAPKIEEIEIDPENDLEKRFGKYCEKKQSQREAYCKMEQIGQELNDALMDAQAEHLLRHVVATETKKYRQNIVKTLNDSLRDVTLDQIQQKLKGSLNDVQPLESTKLMEPVKNLANELKNLVQTAPTPMSQIEQELKASLEEAEAQQLCETTDLEDRRKLMESSKNVINSLGNVVQTVINPDLTERSGTANWRTLRGKR